MLILFRWLLRIATALVVIFVVGFGGVYYFLSRSLPDYSSTWEVRWLGGEVENASNTHNEPHIFG